MRKIIPLFVILAILLSGFIVTPAYAGGGEEFKIISAQDTQLSNIFTFDKLGYSEKLMVGPFDSASLAFSLPANVKLVTGSSIFLKYSIASSQGSSSTVAGTPVPGSIPTGTTTPGTGVGGTLLVYFNDELIDTIVLAGDGSQEVEIPIPDTALNLVDKDGRYRLRLLLNASVNCRSDNLRTTLIVSKSSQFNFQYKQVPPVVDLSLLPRPFYQPDSILPNSVLIVIPDKPEAFELQAALTVVAGLGSITNGELSVKLVVNSNLTQEMVASNHLIFVGLARKFPGLRAVKFPMAISSNGAVISQEHAADGVIEMGVSPWSASNIVLFVGGNSQDAVIKASQTFSTGNIIAVEKPNLSLIAAVNPSKDAIPAAVDQTFQDLGYPSETMGLFGENYFSYVFYAAPEQANSTGAYIDLVLSHSDLLNYDSTGVTIRLNDQVIGGVHLSQESPVTTQLKLIPGVLRRGINRLEIFSDVIPYNSCYSTSLQSTWVTVSETSNIHLPIADKKLDVGKSVNLHDFPNVFLTDRNLGDLAFVLPPNDPISWDYASQVAYYIGTKGSVPLVSLHAAYAGDVSDDILNHYSLLVFGQASTLPFISKINDRLPAPFKPGSDEAVQPSMLVNYSLLPNTSVGYLQLLASPWNPDQVILAVLGNTHAGIPMAGTTLTKDDLVARLSGNFAVLYSDQVVTTDTRLGLNKESIISQLPVAVTVTPAADATVAPATGKAIESRPQWILPVVGAVTLAVLGLLVFMLRKESVANRVPKDTKTQGDDPLDTPSKNL